MTMNIPTTIEKAAETFRCEPYACTLTGASCAHQHVRAVQTQDARRQHCIGCEAGEARARLLNAGPVVCRIPDAAGVECGREPEPNRAQCRKHRAHKSIPGVISHGADKFQPRQAPERMAR